MIILKDVNKDNWFDVIMLRSAEDMKNKIFERDIASNCFSLAQASIDQNWTTKAIYNDDTLVGFTMYGYSDELNGYELCRIMIDYNHQGKGYGKQALKLILKKMKEQYDDCERVLLTFHTENERAKNVYESVGFQDTGEVVKHFVEEYIYSFDMGKVSSL